MNELRWGESLRVGGVTLTPLSRVTVHAHPGARGVCVLAGLDPLGVRIDTPEGSRFCDVTGRTREIDELDF